MPPPPRNLPKSEKSSDLLYNFFRPRLRRVRKKILSRLFSAILVPSSPASADSGRNVFHGQFTLKNTFFGLKKLRKISVFHKLWNLPPTSIWISIEMGSMGPE